MNETHNRSLVVVYQSPDVADVQLVRSVLATEGIHATVSEPNDPFLGVPIIKSEVLVWAEDEDKARQLIQHAHQRHRERTTKETHSK